MILEWQRPENVRLDYIPPAVQQGIVSAATFWAMAHVNARIRGDPEVLVAHASAMLARSQEVTDADPT